MPDTKMDWEKLHQWFRENPIEHKVMTAVMPRESLPFVPGHLTHGIFPDFEFMRHIAQQSVDSITLVTLKERKSRPEDSKYVFDPDRLREYWDVSFFKEKKTTED